MGRQLFAMITREQFPYRDAVMNQRHNARVSDGFMRLTVDGDVTYASPNAISCFRRLGMVDMMQGKNQMCIRDRYCPVAFHSPRPCT